MTAPSDSPDIPPASLTAAAVVAPVLPASLSHFAYTAQTEHGLRFNGTIEAPDGGAAVRILEAMRLRVAEVTAVDKPPRQERVGDDAFLVFNEQLAKLARSGLPIEKGLRLIATDMRRGRLARAIVQVSDDVERGAPLGEAFAKYRKQFPPLYGRLLGAAVGGGNIPGVLLNLGRHVDAQKRLYKALWRATAQPMMTLCGLLIVVGFIGMVVMPQFRSAFADFRIKLPFLTQAVFWFGSIAPYLAMTALATLAVFAIAWMLFRAAHAQALATDRFLLRVAFVGPVLRFNLISRWLDAVRIGVVAGLELPAAIALAGEATASPLLRQDGAQLIAALAAKGSLSNMHGRLLPATVPATLEYAAGQHELADTLQTLCDLYARQAELRLERIPAVVTPILVIAIAIVTGFILCGMLLPLFLFIHEMTRFR